MLYPAMSELLKNVDSRYLLVNVVAHRARQLSIESELTHEPLEEKPVTLARSPPARSRPRSTTNTDIDPKAQARPLRLHSLQKKGSPFRGRFPLSGGNVPKGQKG